MKVNLKIDPSIREDQIEITVRAMTPKIERILSILGETADNEIVPLELDEKTFFIHAAQISHVYSEQNKCYAISQQMKYRYKGTLKQFEEQYQHHSFIRISKHCLANLSWMNYFKATFGGSLVLVFKNGMQEVVSRKYALALKKILVKE